MGLFYNLSADDRAVVLKAKSSKDVPIKTRNKLYAALGRFLDKPSVPAAVAKTWENAETKGPHGKFELLQQWAKDTSGGTVKLTEKHNNLTDDYDDTEWSWMTKWDLYAAKKAFHVPELKAYCDKLIANAKSKKHPDPKFKNDPDMKLYKILGSNVEGHKESSKRASEMVITANVAKDGHASVINQFAQNAKVANDDGGETPKSVKKPKFSIDSLRTKKVQDDLTTCTAVVKDIDDNGNAYLTPIRDNINTKATNLRDLTHQMHDATLASNTDQVDELWASVVDVCMTLKNDIDNARALMNPKAFIPYSTPWDVQLGLK